MTKRLFMIVIVASTISGCSGVKKADEYPVSGVVTFDGAPVDKGRITFQETGGSQRSFAGDIHDGAYTLQAAPGEMKVMIIASRPIPGKFDNSNGTSEPVGEMYIPENYNSKSDLTATVKSGNNEPISFDLKKK